MPGPREFADRIGFLSPDGFVLGGLLIAEQRKLAVEFVASSGLLFTGNTVQ